MNRIIATYIAALLAVISLNAETYSLNVGEFSKLKVVESINVDYRCNPDSAGLVIFSTKAPEMASMIGLSNKNGELSVSFTVPASEMKLTDIPTVTVYSSFLTKVENSGDSLVRVMTVLPCPCFSASLIGNGRIAVRDITATQVTAAVKTGKGQISLYGKCDDLTLTMYGTGTIQADGLLAQNVKVRAYGTGAIGCNPDKLLKISGLGSTTVYYKGSPELRNRAVGVKVEKLL